MLKQMRILIAACLLVWMGAMSASAATAQTFTFEKGLDEQGIAYSAYNSKFTVNNGVLEMEVEQPDVAGGIPILVLSEKLSINADENKYVTIAIKNTSTIGKAQLYFATADEPGLDENKSLVIDIGTNMADFQTYTFDFSTHEQWKGTLKSLRLDSITGSGIEKGMKVYLQSVAVASSAESTVVPSNDNAASADTEGQAEVATDEAVATAANPKTGDMGISLYAALLAVAAGTYFIVNRRHNREQA